MARRVYVPATGLDSWCCLLADPEKHWKRGASAFETAVYWENGARTKRGLPSSLAALLDMDASWRDCSVVAAYPEHRVALEGGARASQNDVWAHLHSKTGALSLAVEGKATESFDNLVADWLKIESDGKKRRLEYLRSLLGLPDPVDASLRYQLFHRAASAIIEAERIGAVSSGMVVLSFKVDSVSKQDAVNKQDFANFAAALGAEFTIGSLCWTKTVSSMPFFLAWLDLPVATDKEVAAATE